MGFHGFAQVPTYGHAWVECGGRILRHIRDHPTSCRAQRSSGETQYVYAVDDDAALNYLGTLARVSQHRCGDCGLAGSGLTHQAHNFT